MYIIGVKNLYIEVDAKYIKRTIHITKLSYQSKELNAIRSSHKDMLRTGDLRATKSHRFDMKATTYNAIDASFVKEVQFHSVFASPIKHIHSTIRHLVWVD